MLEMNDVERRDNSRLSCQIIASPELDGLIPYVHDLVDKIHHNAVDKSSKASANSLALLNSD
jgi:hypothetical protein